MEQDDAAESTPDQQRDVSGEGEDSNAAEGNVEDETFVDGWVRKARASGDLDDEMLDLINENRADTSLDEDGLLNALLNHSEEKLKDDNE